MNDRFLAGIDVGTTGAKTGIFDLNGKLISSGYVEYMCSYPKPNWVEQDATHLAKSALESAREAISKSDIDSKNIASVSLSTQRTCSIFIDRDGNPLRPMISWRDNRTTKEVEEINSKISPKEYYAITGLPSNTTWILSKILWIQKNEPKKWEKVYKVIQLQDYILRELGADDYFVDISDAGLFGIWDTDNFKWSEKLLNLFYIDRDILPTPKPSGEIVGKISVSTAKKTGFSVSTPICVGAGDQNSAVVGAGIIYDGYLSVSLGTGGIAIAYLDDKFRDPNEKTIVTNHAIYGKWQLEGYQAGAAGVFRWFRDEIASLEKVKAEESGKDVYRILDEMIEKTPVGAKGLVFLPYLASATAPRWNSNARGTLVGLTFAHDKSCLARAFIEGITLELKDIVRSMLDSLIDIKNIHIMGGPTKSGLWNQIQSDMYGRTVKTLKVTDAAVLGAAILGGVGVGIFTDIRDGVSKMVKVDREYNPIKKNVEIYNELYDIYCRIYDGLESRDVYKSIAKIQEKY